MLVYWWSCKVSAAGRRLKCTDVSSCAAKGKKTPRGPMVGFDPCFGRQQCESFVILLERSRMAWPMHKLSATVSSCSFSGASCTLACTAAPVINYTQAPTASTPTAARICRYCSRRRFSTSAREGAARGESTPSLAFPGSQGLEADDFSREISCLCQSPASTREQ